VYKPADGDRVIVTRHRPDGRTTQTAGVIHFTDGVDGFTVDGWHQAGAEAMLLHHNVVQTVEPQPPD
jgi:hypothetical protein